MLLMISMHWRRVTSTTLNLKRDNLCKSKVGPLQRELNRAQFLLNSCRTKRELKCVRKIPAWNMSLSTLMEEQFKDIILFS